MKFTIFCKAIVFAGLAFVFSCRQDPIFFTISTETVPKKPRIEGSPTNMVVFERNGVPVMYTASGRLHWYARAGGGRGNAGWDSAEYSLPQPGGNIVGLAATGKHLYALCLEGSGISTVLRRIGADGANWQNVPVDESRYTSIQVIYADTDKKLLFAGAMSNRGVDFGILYLIDDDAGVQPMRLLEGDTGMLSGAASRNNVHYLSTRGKGVYSVADSGLSSGDLSSVAQLTDTEGTAVNRLFMGMIKLENGSIIVVERDGGFFYEARGSELQLLRYSNGDIMATGKFATGSLALWQDSGADGNGNPVFDENGDRVYGEKRMLVAGIQGGLFNTTTSSYTHGYTEFDTDFEFVDEWLVFTSSRRNNSPSITVHGNTDRYTAAIGKHPINHFYQASKDIDADIIFFASTQTAGLWSYRFRSSGGWQWNAED